MDPPSNSRMRPVGLEAVVVEASERRGSSKVDASPNEINLFYMRPRHRHSVET